MDSQDYLDQISREAKMGAPKKGIMDILTSKYFKWGAIVVGVFIVIALVGALLSGGVSFQDKCLKLKLRLDQTNEVIAKYQPYIKSSSLRSISASLSGVFTNTATGIGNFVISTYGPAEEGDTKEESLLEEAMLNADELSSELFEAKINGLLDRTYAHKMALEIYSVMSEEMSLYNSADQAELKALLESSHTSLDNLYTKFNDFSETK